ncbi:MAG: phosphopantetheine-binding protein [Deltaproteobacteria bacterium]
MTTTEKIRGLILKVAKGKLSQEALKPEARLSEELGLDSLAQSELLVLAEDSFGVKFTHDEVWTVATIGQMVEVIDSRLAAK